MIPIYNLVAVDLPEQEVCDIALRRILRSVATFEVTDLTLTIKSTLVCNSFSMPIDFPNQGTSIKRLYAFPIMRRPRGKLFGHRAEPRKNPDRIVFSVDERVGEVTFIGLMSHAGCEQQGFERNEFEVSATYY